MNIALCTMLCACGSSDNESSSMSETSDEIFVNEAYEQIEIAQESLDSELETQEQTLERLERIGSLFYEEEHTEAEIFATENYNKPFAIEYASEETVPSEAQETEPVTQEKVTQAVTEKTKPQLRPLG